MPATNGRERVDELIVDWLMVCFMLLNRATIKQGRTSILLTDRPYSVQSTTSGDSASLCHSYDKIIVQRMKGKSAGLLILAQ